MPAKFPLSTGCQTDSNSCALREQLAKSSLAGSDADLQLLENVYLYRLPEGKQASSEAVLFERHPSYSNGQCAEFADGHIEFIRDEAHLRELIEPWSNTPSKTVFQFRWVAAEGDTNSPAEVLPDASAPDSGRTFRVLQPPVLTDADVSSASFSESQSNQKFVEVLLSEAGGKKFSEITAKNVGHRLAIVWQGRVISAPVINSPISGRSVSITGNFTDAEAKQLLDLLNHRQPTAQSVQKDFGK